MHVAHVIDEQLAQLGPGTPASPVRPRHPRESEFGHRPLVVEITNGRGERGGASLTQQSLRFVMINRTPRTSFPATARSA